MVLISILMMYLSLYQIFNTILTHYFDILCIFASVIILRSYFFDKVISKDQLNK